MSFSPDRATLDEISIAEALSRRPPRPPNWQAEVRAMRALAGQMANNSETQLQTLVEIALELCRAGTAGVSLLETTPEGEEIFRWSAMAGRMAESVGTTVPRHFSPCGICLERDTFELYSYPERYFTFLQSADTSIVEALVLPLTAENVALGTIWIVSHDEGREFDPEDLRVMSSLADFTATALLLDRHRTRELGAMNERLEAEVAERRRAEEATSDMTEYFRAIAELVPDLLWEHDTVGNTCWVNRRWLDYTGQPLTENGQFDWLKVIHPDDRDRAVASFLNAIEAGTPFRGTFYLRGKDDRYRWFLVQARPQRDGDGRIVRWFGSATDIHEQCMAIEALRHSEERYRTLFEFIDEGFCIIEMIFDETETPVDYRFLEANPSFEKETGLESIRGKRMREIAPEHEAYWFEIYGNVALTGEPVRCEHYAEQLGRWFDLYAFRFGDPANRQVAVLFTNVTDRKRAERERDNLLERERAARAEAERANRIKDEFLAILSHELRTPLNPILGWTQILQKGKFDETKIARALTVIERNTRLQIQLIDDLLDIARILRGKLSLNMAPVHLASVVEAAVETVRAAAVEKSISIHARLSNIGQVFGDAVRLQQIVWNLLSNAIKFTPQNGQIYIRLEKVGDRAELTVRDTGQGIGPDFLPDIFESFRQENTTIARQHGGLGLGLAIVRQLVENHGGTIAADSPGEGSGATFTVRLPLLDGETESDPGAMEEFPAEFDLSGIRVLTVDDDFDTCELLKALLTPYGASVLALTSPTEVMAALESFRPDLLIADLGMPDIDGFALIRRIRNLPPERGGEIPAIALTAYARIEDGQRTLASGYQRYLTKPLELEQLVEAVAVLTRS